jgi:hypothetical protein
MYRKVENAPREAEDFELPFERKLSQDNRWVIMASLVPWEEFEEEYAQNFSRLLGAPALPFRVALGSLIIKEKWVFRSWCAKLLVGKSKILDSKSFNHLDLDFKSF